MMPLWTTTIRPVRVRVFFRRAPVCRPPRVADAVEAVGRVLLERLFEVYELAGRPPQAHTLGADECHTGRVIPTVFHPAQPVDQDRDHRFRADIADDSTHVLTLVLLATDPACDVGLASASDSERARCSRTSPCYGKVS